jgi:hypothetical protein
VDKSSGKLPEVIEGVLKANTFARQAEVKAWEQEFTPCEHTLCLEQEKARNIESGGTHLSRPLLLSSDLCSPWALLELRPKRKSLAMSSVWQSWMRPSSVWRRGWKRPWITTY